jgi:two-component system, NtrC family, nitrogen regulation sensor histidine kinase GlnL
MSPSERRLSAASQLAGLNFLANGVVLVDSDGRVAYMNQAAEQLFDQSLKAQLGLRFSRLFTNDFAIDSLLADVTGRAVEQKRQDISLERIAREPLNLHVLALAVEHNLGAVLLEFSEVFQRDKVVREEHMADLAAANKELVRNLAHEIKNPLGGIRGAAQLLQDELDSPNLREYTQVIIKESDRLQALVDRLLAPHRRAHVVNDVNIHEVCERVRSVLLAQYPQDLVFVRDYDASLPELKGDREQLIQVVLNLVSNAAQAMHGKGQIRLRTRVERQITIARKRHKLALVLHVQDNGPGVPAEIKERVFLPLVSGREGGSGLGLSLVQTFVQQHGGMIDFESIPGHTDFRIVMPLP